MLSDELKYRIRQEFGFLPTPEQEHALDVFARFLTDRDDRTVMILSGSAGTGKTSLAAAIVRTLTALKQKQVLMAPTGRAAKVFSIYAGHAAYTIHRRIYRQRTAADDSSFSLNDNLHRHTLFVVDEASMIPNQGLGESAFGTGCLLDDLVTYVYGQALDAGNGCRLLLIGDRAQLPPVGEAESPALAGPVMQAYGLTVYQADLSQVVRQAQDSGVLYNATAIRQMITHDELTQLPVVRLSAFPDISIVPGSELVESLATSYSRAGLDDTIVITRSNKRANIYNQGIRNMVLDREEMLCRGDRLMIVRNNYSLSVTPPDGESATERTLPVVDGGKLFLANGDRAVVQRVRQVRELYGFHFASVTFQMPDYDDLELESTVLLDTLTTEAPALTREQQQQLYEAVMADYDDIPLKADRLRKLKTDSYYNALQVKYAYAVTCHKAQGGQWEHVYLDQGYMTDDMLTPDYIHWLYTAFTRATGHLFLVNWPKTQTAQ